MQHKSLFCYLKGQCRENFEPVFVREKTQQTKRFAKLFVFADMRLSHFVSEYFRENPDRMI